VRPKASTDQYFQCQRLPYTWLKWMFKVSTADFNTYSQIWCHSWTASLPPMAWCGATCLWSSHYRQYISIVTCSIDIVFLSCYMTIHLLLILWVTILYIMKLLTPLVGSWGHHSSFWAQLVLQKLMATHLIGVLNTGVRQNMYFSTKIGIYLEMVQERLMITD